jgi:hypothetical protein
VILRSNKLYDDVELQLWNYNEFTMHRLSEIFHKFKQSIRKITFKFAAISEPCLIKLLNMLPNLEDITIDVSLINSSMSSQQKLSQLKSIKSFTSKVEAAKIIFELPNDVVTKLSFTSVLKDALPSVELLQDIFDKQRKIEELNFDPEKVDPASLELLKLKKLRLASSSNSLVILENQQSLTSLSMQEPVTNDEFVKICNFQRLESLSIKVKNVDPKALIKLNRIQSLKELVLTLDRVYPVNAFCDIALPHLEKLELNFMCDTNTQAFLENFSTNFPSLKNLKLTFADIKAIQSLLLNKNLQSLDINKVTSSDTAELQRCTIKHENLRELKIGHEFSQYLIDLITDCLPNLEKLLLCNNLINDLNTLQNVMVNCKRLTHISVVNQNCHPVLLFNQLITLLKSHGKNLIHFEYGDIKFACAVEKLKCSFDAQYQFIYSKHEDKRLVMRNGKW